MKKVLAIVLATCFCLTLPPVSISANAAGESYTVLSFIPADAVSNDDGSVIYLSDKAGKKIYSIDTTTFEQQSLSFDLMPESMYYKDGKLYVALLMWEYSADRSDKDQSGAFAIIDCATFTVTAQHSIGLDPYDIVVSNDDNIYIASGSGQWTSILGYGQAGDLVTPRGQIRHKSAIQYDSARNRIYAITSESSQRSISAFRIQADGSFEDRGGNMGTSYSWPYNRDYSIGTAFHIAPDGAYIFNSSGHVFTCRADQADDMRFKISLNRSWTALAFSEDGTKFYTALDNRQVYAYDYPAFTAGFMEAAAYAAQGYPQYMFAKGDALVAVSRETATGGKYFIEIVDVSVPVTTVEQIAVSTNNLLIEDGRALLGVKSNAKTVFNGNMMYVADNLEKAVFVVDTAALTETRLTFPDTPNSLYYDNGELFVGFGNNGVVMILDAQTSEIKDRLVTEAMFYDMAAGKDGFIYIIEHCSGFETGYVRSYSRTTGQQYSSVFTYPQKGNLEPHPIDNSLYWADIGISPQDVHTLKYANGVINAVYDSPYHGTYSIGSRVRISPDGAYIFTSSGNVFSCSSVKANDIKFELSLNPKWADYAFVDLAFNENGTEFYTALSRRLIYAYDYATFEGTAAYETQGYPQNMIVKGDTVTALSKETPSGSVFFLETIDLTAPKTTIDTTITSKRLSVENGRAELSAKANDKTVFNGDMMYIADSMEKAVYAIDTAALVETKIAFPNAPNSLYYDDNELFVGFGDNGIVAILDADTFAEKEQLIMGVSFNDVAAGKDGYVYVIENKRPITSSNIPYMRSSSRATGQQVSSARSDRVGKFVPHPIDNSFYWADTEVSPQDVNTLKYANGVISAAYDSPYHGPYPIGNRIRISPDGAYIFTGSGSVFTCSNVKADDMRYKDKFISYVDLAFDLPNAQMFASGSKANLYVYDYATYEVKGFIKTVSPVKEMSLNGESILAMSSEDNKVFYLELLNSSEVVTPEKITVDSGDMIILENSGTVNLNPTLWYTDGTSKNIADTAVYTSSDKTVATVNSAGRVQAVSRGHAVITVASEGITKSIDVYVGLPYTVDDDEESAAFTAATARAYAKRGSSLTVRLPAGAITLDPDALAALADAAGGDDTLITLEARVVPMSELTGKQASQIRGSETVVSIDVFVGGVKVDVPLTISLSYTIKQNEDPNAVCVWHLDDDGNLTQLAAVYDPQTKMVTFTIDHQSYFVVGYEAEEDGVSVIGQVKSYNPQNKTTVQLLRGHEVKYTAFIEGEPGFGQATQPFTFAGVAPGEYSLVITKPGHTSFAVQTVIVGNTDVDLTQDIRCAVQCMTLVCGDINGDEMINDNDLIVIWQAANYNRNAGQAANPLCDLNGDGVINDNDLIILWLAVNYNKGPVVIP